MGVPLTGLLRLRLRQEIFEPAEGDGQWQGLGLPTGNQTWQMVRKMVNMWLIYGLDIWLLYS